MRSELELIPIGFIDPDSWSIIKWSITSSIRINGKRKCNIKKRFNVGLVTA